MILTVEVRLGNAADREAVVAFVRIVGPDRPAGRADYAVGAVEGACVCGRPARSAGCAVDGRGRQGLWALLESACAALSEADFIDC